MLKYFPYLTDIYKEDKNGDQKLVKKDVIRTAQIETDFIDDITEYIDDKGKVDPNKSIILHERLGTLIVPISTKELWLEREKNYHIVIQGFKIETENETRTSKRTIKKRVIKRPSKTVSKGSRIKSTTRGSKNRK